MAATVCGLNTGREILSCCTLKTEQRKQARQQRAPREGAASDKCGTFKGNTTISENFCDACIILRNSYVTIAASRLSQTNSKRALNLGGGATERTQFSQTAFGCQRKRR